MSREFKAETSRISLRNARTQIYTEWGRLGPIPLLVDSNGNPAGFQAVRDTEVIEAPEHDRGPKLEASVAEAFNADRHIEGLEPLDVPAATVQLDVVVVPPFAQQACVDWLGETARAMALQTALTRTATA